MARMRPLLPGEKRASCPSCRAPVVFRLPGPLVETCVKCRLVVLRTDVVLRGAVDPALQHELRRRSARANRERPTPPKAADGVDEAPVLAFSCAACGGELNHPLGSPGDYFQCRFCGAVTPAPDTKPPPPVVPERAVFAPRVPTDPYLDPGRQGRIRGEGVRVVGFAAFACAVPEGTSYHLEYMLEAGPRGQCRRLLEQDGHWYLVTPLGADEVTVQVEPAPNIPSMAVYRREQYLLHRVLSVSLARKVGVRDASTGVRRPWSVETFGLGKHRLRVEYLGAHGMLYASCEPLSPLEVAEGFQLDSLPPNARVKVHPKSFGERFDSYSELFGAIYLSIVVAAGIVILLADRCHC